MRSLQNQEILAVSGGLTSNQASYLMVMGAQAAITSTTVGAFQYFGSTPEGLAIKHVLLPLLAILGTACAYELHNRVVEPTIFNPTTGA